MDQLAIFFVVLASFTLATGTPAYSKSNASPTPCKNDTDCAPEQCCYIKPQFEVVSRQAANRPLILAPLPTPVKHDTGVCEDYGIQGDSCSQMAVMNGHCGCAPGLVCGGLVWIIDRPGSRFVGRGLNPTLYPGNEDMHKILDKFEFRPDRPLTTELAALERLKNFP